MAAKTRRKTKRSSRTTSGYGRRRRRPKVTARGARKRRNKGMWSHRVTETSDALDLDRGVFTLDSPRKIASSLKRSAERSKRRKANPYRSALSMLTFYINRAGRNLSARRKNILNRAKEELRTQFGRGSGHAKTLR